MHEPTPTPIPIHDLSDEPSAEERPAPGPSGVEQAIDILIGLVTLGASATTSVVRGTDPPPPQAGNADLVAGAAAGFLIEGLRAAGAMLTALERTVVAPAAAAAGTAADRPEIRELLEHWQGSWEAQRERSDPAASEALRQSIRRGADALMNQLDVTDLVLEHVDIQRLAEQVDVDALMEGADVNGIAARIDVDAIAARLDVDAMLDRLDLTAIAAHVLEQLDLPELIREATADTTSEGVRSVRIRGVGADRMVRRTVDRVLRRTGDEQKVDRA